MSLQTCCLSTAEAISTTSSAIQCGLERSIRAQSFSLYETCFNSKITIFSLEDVHPPLQRATFEHLSCHSNNTGQPKQAADHHQSTEPMG